MLKEVDIVLKAKELGYEQCGIVHIEEMKAYAKKLDERIEKFPELANHFDDFYEFADIKVNYPWAKSIIICSRWYGKYLIPDSLKGRFGKYYLTDGRVDINSKDYQDSLEFERYLKENGIETKTERKFGVTALRWAAVKAGIGIVRKNNFIYTDNGSWNYLEAFLIDRKLEYVVENSIKSCPPNCKLCIDSCPTKSLAEPYMMNRSTCISCLTTWEGWDLTKEPNSRKMGEWVYGCDICQDVCPFNRNSWNEIEEFPELSKLEQKLSLEQIVIADYDVLSEIVQTKLWYIPVDKIWRFKTNALNAMLNSFKPDYLRIIQDASKKDPNKNVRDMAKWVLTQLKLNND
ncbi:epoxyqueuosine reductase [Acidaminobacter sp. JC074]|uniref:epoxyqueuosine reductase n=1 Tax=Acidaminobacter sp. JC074 TaxID=2530199 RepID=UPI001F105F04|nr:4Fe-4S double cluster binding domain-containing protein [Acidaminobacter sp. JC074]MCH4888900.1 epoxyqueuosine reductase [Acidaminobacter sp. JC074]